MKKFSFITSTFFAALVTCGLVLTSCEGDSNTISKGDIEDAIENLPIMGDSVCQGRMYTGYYEIDHDDYVAINQMMNAGLVKATFEIKKQNTYEYRNYKRVDVVKKHMFTTVELTEKGKEYEIFTEREKVRKDYKDIYNKLDKKEDIKLPSFMTLEKPVLDYYDNALKTKNDKEEYTEDSYNNGYRYSDSKSSNSGNDLDEYDLACKKSKQDLHKVVTAKLKIDEIFNIQYTEEMQKNGTAKCSFLLRIVDITPFGYALKIYNESEYLPGTATLVKYVDKGWVIDSFNEDKHIDKKIMYDL